jgi:hypothetical protein
MPKDWCKLPALGYTPLFACGGKRVAAIIFTFRTLKILTIILFFPLYLVIQPTRI